MEEFIEEQNLIVISDFHLGNPAFMKRRNVVDFFEFVLGQDANLCINGDGVDFLQPSMEIFASYLPVVARQLLSMVSAGKRVYYIIGNHDLFLEHFLYNWGTLEIAPFLNISSGGRRIHIEHGHIYDTMFAAYPELYVKGGRIAGKILNIWPGFFKLLYRIEDLMSLLSRKTKREEMSSYLTDAQKLLNRGFDVVIFGHTHRVENRDINGKIYMNPGAWEDDIRYIHILNGNVAMKKWE